MSKFSPFLLIAVGSYLPLLGQSTMSTNSLVVGVTPHSSINISPLAPSLAPDLAKAFDSESMKFSSGFAILSNNSQQSVVALAAIWRYTDSSTGAQKRMEFLSDSFQTPDTRPVIEAGVRVLLGPNAIIPERLAREHGASGYLGAIQAETLQPLEKATDLKLDVDLIVFADGEMFGPDMLRTSTDLVARYSAAKKIAAALDSARTSGRSPASALSDYLKPATTAQSLTPADFEKLQEENWIRRYSQQAVRSKHPDAVLGYLQRMPKPIQMYRHTAN